MLKQADSRIVGFPLVNGLYWYYKYGQVVPSVVDIIDVDGVKAIKEGGGIQKWFRRGEYFVGPIIAPHATPPQLAKNHGHEAAICYERQNETSSIDSYIETEGVNF